MFRKPKCADCGYLCRKVQKRIFRGESHPFGPEVIGDKEYEHQTEYSEITPQQRIDLPEIKKEVRDILRDIFCYRHAVLFEKELKSLDTDELPERVKDLLEKPRECKSHIKYIPGYDPAQHLMRWESIERDRVNRRWNLLFAALGSGITVAVMMIIRHFGGLGE